MRLSLYAAALLCAAVLPSSAFAAVYDFSSTETSALGSPSYSFDIDTSTGIASGGATLFSNVTIDDSGVSSSGNTVTFASPTELGSSSFFFIDTDTPTKDFGAGAGPAVIFNPGIYKIADGETDGEGSLVISQVGVSAAPEPSTWLLMLAGIGGIGLMLRRAKKTMDVPFGDAFSV